MGYKVEMRADALEEFKKLDNSVRILITKLINRLEKADNPKALGKQLKENLKGYWSYRVDNYRIVADIQDDKLIILVISIGHRSTIYEKTDRKLNQ